MTDTSATARRFREIGNAFAAYADGLEPESSLTACGLCYALEQVRMRDGLSGSYSSDEHGLIYDGLWGNGQDIGYTSDNASLRALYAYLIAEYVASEPLPTDHGGEG